MGLKMEKSTPSGVLLKTGSFVFSCGLLRFRIGFPVFINRSTGQLITAVVFRMIRVTLDFDKRNMMFFCLGHQDKPEVLVFHRSPVAGFPALAFSPFNSVVIEGLHQVIAV